MTISPWMVYLGASTVVGIASRLWVVGRRDLRARRSFSSRLFDESVLSSALAPDSDGSDDEDVLAELASTLSHLNRQTYAEEMWALDGQLGVYYARIPRASRPTMQRALRRMLESGDRWLTAVAAKTAAAIPLPDLTADVESAAKRASSAPDSDPYLATLRRSAKALQSAPPT